MKTETGRSKLIRELLVMTFATAVIAAAVFFFLMPSHTSVSSVSGLAIVLANFIPFTVAQITLGLNAVLLIIGFLTCGNEFGFKTVYTSILLPLMLRSLERIFPDFTSLTGEAAIDVVCYIFVVSLGLSILFNMNASSGGIDIIAKILNRYLHMDLGRAMSAAGMAVALSSAFAYDSKTVVLSVLGTYVNGLVLDHFIFGQDLKRRVCIVSERFDEFRDYIINELGSGATVYEAMGAYNMEVRREIVTIVDKREYQRLMDFIQKTDPAAFVTVYEVSNMRYISKKTHKQGGRG